MLVFEVVVFVNTSGYMSIHENLWQLDVFFKIFDFFLIFVRGELEVNLRGSLCFFMYSCLFLCIFSNSENK